MQKLPKPKVNYRVATTDQRCGNCAMFHMDTRTCDLVSGRIESSSTCDRWTQRRRPPMSGDVQ